MTVKLHRWNAVLLLFFLVLHFGTHFAGLLGPQVHGDALEAATKLYRIGFVEPVLLGAFAMQVVLGIALVRKRKKAGIEKGWGTIQVVSGAYLAMFITVHALSALFARYANGLDTNFWWPASTLAHSELSYFFYPYYTLAVCALFAHLAAALYYGSGQAKSARALLVAGPVVALLIIAGFGGWFRDISVPAEYMGAFQNYIPGAAPS
ncbi:hypothetical protein [Qipengyuania gelatinilytica]|uniref:Uncharacterized protein n=1 Tax=Qipengyuania gelatinilytica TaxID=2867231 RepID=A0ABX9A4M6_9SPHN|nr:hypothetical protein [Qipengyuania gelatinilytica]QZD96016.1 hypothetical protein K3136_04725 [Qipengyuania gelatinilytica]